MDGPAGVRERHFDAALAHPRPRLHRVKIDPFSPSEEEAVATDLGEARFIPHLDAS